MTLANPAAEVDRHASLFRSSRSSVRIAKDYLGWELTAFPPLSISHGVDLDHERYPQDALNAEPIHWCYSEEMHARVSAIKPGLLLAHPWLLLDRMLGERRPPPNGRTLVVGPPTSMTNDRRLAEALERAGIAADAILVKERDGAQTERSWEFWSERGIQPVSAGSLGGEHVNKLYDILTRYEHVALPVFSSVGILAAAVGCRIRLVRPYAHCSYTPKALDLGPLVRSPKARRLLASLASGEQAETTAHCREVLGASLLGVPRAKRAELERLVQSLELPAFVASARSGRLRSKVMREVALASGRIDFLKNGFRRSIYLKLFGADEEVVWKRVDMFDALENGLSARNYVSRPLRDSERGARSGRGAEDDDLGASTPTRGD